MVTQSKSAPAKGGRKQLFIITLIVFLGLVAGALMLRDGSGTKAVEAQGQSTEASGEDGHGHQEEGAEGAKEEEHAHGAEGAKEEEHGQEGTKEEEHGHAEEGGEHDEGKVAMTDEQVKEANIALATATPGVIRSALQFPGEIKFNEDRTAHVVPRVGGVVDSVNANLGQQVKKGDLLAVVSSTTVSEIRAELQGAQRRRQLAKTTYEREKTLWEEKISPEQDVLQARQALREAEIATANASQKLLALGATTSSSSLGRFELRAPFDGIVVEKHISLGESVKEDANVFTISDLSTVWAEMNVAARDLPQVRVGEKAVVRASAFDAAANGTVSYVGSLIGEQTRTARARVVLPNPQGAWRPGLFVNVELTADEANAPVTISSDALQTLEDKPVVFLKVPGGFVPRRVELGRTDGNRVEIKSGLEPGATYAAEGSFVVKSEQGKSSATHTH